MSEQLDKAGLVRALQESAAKSCFWSVQERCAFLDLVKRVDAGEFDIKQPDPDIPHECRTCRFDPGCPLRVHDGIMNCEGYWQPKPATVQISAPSHGARYDTQGHPRFAMLLGKRPIAADCLAWVRQAGYNPAFVLYDDEELTPFGEMVLKAGGIDYIFCVHYHKILPKEILEIPRKGCVNLHPAYLPWCRGWHTPSWAILDGTPAGATMHYMTEEVDAGDIIWQQKVEISPADTAHTLYQRVLEVEGYVFMRGFMNLMNGTAGRLSQSCYAKRTDHKKSDLADIQPLSTGEQETISLLRALTTNDITEAAYFEQDGRRYAVQVHIEELP